MRTPRDAGAELKPLEDKARDLKMRKVVGLWRTVTATEADALTTESWPARSSYYWPRRKRSESTLFIRPINLVQ